MMDTHSTYRKNHGCSLTPVANKRIDDVTVSVSVSPGCPVGAPRPRQAGVHGVGTSVVVLAYFSRLRERAAMEPPPRHPPFPDFGGRKKVRSKS